MKFRNQEIRVGDVITLGRYAPTYRCEQRPAALPIVWRVIMAEDSRFMVLADRVLDMKPFHSAGETYYDPAELTKREMTPEEAMANLQQRLNNAPVVHWRDSSLRAWLNGAFLQEAFDEQERGLIAFDASMSLLADLMWHLSGMELNTKSMDDAVFLLSAEDIPTCFPGKHPFFSGAEALPAENLQNVDAGELCWWLRDVMGKFPMAMIVSPCASIGGSMIEGQNAQGVRPAMWLKADAE